MNIHFTSPTETITRDGADSTLPTMISAAETFETCVLWKLDYLEALVTVKDPNQATINSINAITGVVERDQAWYDANKSSYTG